MRTKSILIIILTVAVTLTITGGKAMALELKSDVIAEGKPIPSKYTCEGSDVSPPLKWSGAPSGTKSLALIADDPDAPMGTWVHWVAWNIPATATAFPEGGVASGTKQGMTDFKRPGYGGPCPPSGTHRYFFKLYALDALLELPSNAGKGELEKAMKGHILAQTQLMGTYAKQR